MLDSVEVMVLLDMRVSLSVRKESMYVTVEFPTKRKINLPLTIIDCEFPCSKSMSFGVRFAPFICCSVCWPQKAMNLP